MVKEKDKKKKVLKIILIIIAILLLIGIGLFIYFYNLFKIDKDFEKLDLENFDNLMIVAHPDDELLWGGAHLIEDNYLVVCVTCGSNKLRVIEFDKVMKATGEKYIMLGYPDKTNGERDNWDTVREDIISDIDKIIALKDWNIIVTHNPDGEYGHIHHQMTSQIVTDAVKAKYNLYYFGRYYSKKKIGNHYNEMTPIKDKVLAKKEKIIGLYKTQAFIQTSFDHMVPYEEWVPYSDWGDTNETT